MNFPEGWHVRRIADDREGDVANAWTADDGTERVFVKDAHAEAFLSPGVTGEPATAYAGVKPVHAPDIERMAGRRYRGVLPSYSELGSYPLIYLTKRADVLCADCATAQIDAGNDTNDDPVTAVDVFYEGPDETCGNCYKPIPSAYGDPWAKEES